MGYMNRLLFKSMALAMGVTLMAGATAQGLYRWEDKNGRVTYSDTPPPKDAKVSQQKRLGDNIIERERLPAATRDAMQKNPVTLFATNCGAACDDARALLKTRGVPFAEKNPSTDPAGAKLKNADGSFDLPTMMIGEQTEKGFQASAWNARLDEAGYPKSNGNLAPARAAARAPESPQSPASAPTAATPAPPAPAAKK
jgi:hypothetical protein